MHQNDSILFNIKQNLYVETPAWDDFTKYIFGGWRKAEVPVAAIPDSKIMSKLTDGQRIAFFVAYVVVVSIAIVANIVNIIYVSKRKMKTLQKTSTISLAISDIAVACFHGGNNIVMLSHPMNNWILGEFMCAFVPYMQNTGQIANSITMAVIAFDRYRNIVHSLNNQWDPKLGVCLLIFMGIWAVPAGMSLPQFKISNLYGPVATYHGDPHHPTNVQIVYLCQYSDKRETNFIFYTLIGVAAFLPSMVLFLWLYFKIAQLIWSRRQSPTKRYESSSVTVETSVGESKASVKTITETKKTKTKTSSKIHMERKIRTFKIILSIMLIFFLCRMPHWIFNVYRFAVESNKQYHWVLSYVFSFFLVFNTAINPFLYSFLNQTLAFFDKFWKAVVDFWVKICCCFCSEFDDYEKERHEHSQRFYEERNSQSSNIVARGPYIEGGNKYVKFNDTLGSSSSKDKSIGYGVI